MDRESQYQRALDRHNNGDIDRRAFIKLIGSMAAVAGVSGTAMLDFINIAKADGTVRFDGWGGPWQAAMDRLVFGPFTAETGIAVAEQSYGTPDGLLAKIEAEGIGQYNYFAPADELTCLRYLSRGYGTTLDEGRMPRLAGLIPRSLSLLRDLAAGQLSAVPYTISGSVLCYHREKVDRAEVENAQLTALVDPKYKGRITGVDNWVIRIWIAALQTGQDPNDIHDMDAVWEKIRESRRLVLKYYRSGGEQAQIFSSGDVLLGDAYFNLYNLFRKQGLPFDSYPRQGIYINIASFMPLKGAPLEPFYQMVDILLRPEVLNALALELGKPSLIDPTKFQVPGDVKTMPGFDPTGTLANIRTFNAIYWNQNAERWQREYQRVMARG